ncbi:hypothetical protein ACFVFS_24210 [Kitasatospora sp. NPDC057692]|uniref:hypothetical protein n=1 Tax=Kitasatospora sp. NPDC057692 TaxID=3346215 RepID=UPI0036C821FA
MAAAPSRTALGSISRAIARAKSATLIVTATAEISATAQVHGVQTFYPIEAGGILRNLISRIACAVAGVGAMAVMVAPQAQAVPVPDGPSVVSAAGVATRLPAGAVPGHWTVDRQVPAPTLPQGAPATKAATIPQTPDTAAGDITLEARNVRYGGQVCGTGRVDMVTGPGPMTLTLTQSRAIASTWSASVSIPAGKVSAAVGFSVTDTATRTEAGSYTVPAGQFGYLEAYPLYDLFYYDVYSRAVTDHWVGSGNAQHPVGYCYNAWSN